MQFERYHHPSKEERVVMKVIVYLLGFGHIALSTYLILYSTDPTTSKSNGEFSRIFSLKTISRILSLRVIIIKKVVVMPAILDSSAIS
jgi:hypothetical protein